jgi:nitric oxide synthase-interacting protein
MRDLKEINPWLPQFTPQAEAARLKKPSKRPSSPMTSRPLRVSDLIPINMHREQGETATEVKFICPVSRSYSHSSFPLPLPPSSSSSLFSKPDRKSISSQKVIAIKKTNEIMLESVAEELAYPTMTCPLTGLRFTRNDVIPLARAASSFAATGDVVAKKYRPSIN